MGKNVLSILGSPIFKWGIMYFSNRAILFSLLFTGCAQPSPEVSANQSASTKVMLEGKTEGRLIEGYSLVDIPAGSFMMGCTKLDTNCSPAEKPSHKVTLTRSFSMMKTEVTRALYKKVTGKSPGFCFDCDDSCPVEMVSWLDAVFFANELSELEGITPCYSIHEEDKDKYGYPYIQWKDKECMGWRLPTEAEWEFAARGGQEHFFSGGAQLEEVAWFEENSAVQNTHRPHKVASKKANGYGLYDMTGNVAEWVWDFDLRYDKKNNPKGLLGEEVGYPSAEAQQDPISEEKSNFHIYRGGSFLSHRIGSRLSTRGMMGADLSFKFIGFRLVKTQK